jgi:PAS domain S-box-containing protein
VNLKSTILIVDDEPVIRQTLKRLLTAEGYDLALASDGAEALAKAAELVPDLILLDVVMPVMDGFEVCQRLRADPLLAEVPVIMVTALGDRNSRLQGLKAGADDFIAKPFDDVELLTRVHTTTQLNRYRLLLQERAKFERVIELSPNGLMIVSATAKIRLANPAMLRMLGAESKQDVIGKKIQTFVVPSEADYFRAFLSSVIADAPQVAQVETYFTRVNGESFGVQVDAGHFIWDSQPAVEIVVHDITERRQSKEKLEQRNRELALLSRAGQAFNSTLDLDQVLTAVLEEVRRLLNVVACSVWLIDPETDELVCQHASGPRSKIVRGWRLAPGEGLVGWVACHGESLIVPDVRADERHFKGIDHQTGLALRSILSVPLRVKERVIGVLQVVDADADRFNAADLALLEPLAATAATAVENARLFEQARREIAERKRAEEALSRRNEDLMTLNAIATTMGQSLDLKHRLNAALDKVLEVIKMDAGWVQLLDEKDGGALSLIAHRGFSRATLSQPGTLNVVENLTAEVAHSKQPIVITESSNDARFDMGIQTDDTQLAIAATPIQSRDKVLGGLGILGHGPRELGSQEMQLLTAIGHQIGVAIENARLAEEAAETEILRKLNRLRSELIADLSHELRTPLGLIKIFCTTLLREDVEPDRETQREFLGHIDEEAEKLEKIVDHLLDLSRLESGRLQLNKQPTDVSQLAQKVIAAMQTPGTQHRFVHDFPSEPLAATVDAERLEEVLRNLLSNAIRYSPEGGTITIYGRGDKRQLLIWVSDQGMGIPSQDLEKVFERFYRVDNEITQRVRGAGLGLAVCKGIVEAHGGRIWAESIPGVGSTFYLSLPTGDSPQGESN